MIEVKRSAALLEERARELPKAIERGDDAWFADRTADAGEILVYGTAPGEEWRGREAVLSLTLAETRALNEAAGVSEGDQPRIECFEAGDTGWVVVHSHFKLDDGTVVPTRGVSILVRDDGTWKRVFGAVHVLVENDLIVPGSPLASRDG